MLRCILLNFSETPLFILINLIKFSTNIYPEYFEKQSCHSHKYNIVIKRSVIKGDILNYSSPNTIFKYSNIYIFEGTIFNQTKPREKENPKENIKKGDKKENKIRTINFICGWKIIVKRNCLQEDKFDTLLSSIIHTIWSFNNEILTLRL